MAQYYAALLASMGEMLGVALADDLVMLFVFWEITSLTSFLLIGFWYGPAHACGGDRLRRHEPPSTVLKID